jgi:hypothetical protein
MTRPGPKSTIYRTRGKHDNHYATDVVKFQKDRVNKNLSSIYHTRGEHANYYATDAVLLLWSLLTLIKIASIVILVVYDLNELHISKFNYVINKI